jgi:hypothetical protein
MYYGSIHHGELLLSSSGVRYGTDTDLFPESLGACHERGAALGRGGRTIERNLVCLSQSISRQVVQTDWRVVCGFEL